MAPTHYKRAPGCSNSEAQQKPKIPKMSKACMLLFLLGVVVFITTPSLANQHHDNEPPKGKGGKPFPGEHPPEHKPFPKLSPPTHPSEKPPKGKGKEPPHGGKPPHRHLLSKDVEDSYKPPEFVLPPKGKGETRPHKPPHEHEPSRFTNGKPPKKPFPGEKPPEDKPLPENKPPKGKGKEPPHDHKPPHRHLLGLAEPPKFVLPPKAKGKKPPHEHHPGHLLEKDIEDSHKPKFPPHKPPHKPPHSN